MNRRRLEAEAVRDSLLAVAGRLDRTPGGPAVRDFNAPRRTVYLMTIRSDRSGFGPLFDTADSTALVDRRTVSTVAPQALFLMNNPFILEQTKALAKRITDGDKDDRRGSSGRIVLLYGRPPIDGGDQDRTAISWAAAAGRRRRGRSTARCCCARMSSFMWIDVRRPVCGDRCDESADFSDAAVNRRQAPAHLRQRLRHDRPGRPARRRAGRAAPPTPTTRWPSSRRMFAAEGQARHLPVHVRRAVARRSLRPQAAPRPRTTASRCRSSSRSSCAPRPATCSPSPFKFSKHGQSGIEVSELFPNVAGCIDDICVIRSMVADNINHNGACLQMNTGEQAFSRPSLGSWLLYGLGSENQNLPGFVVVSPRQPAQGAPLWSSSFLPAAYQGTLVADLNNPIANLKNPDVAAGPAAGPARRAAAAQRAAPQAARGGQPAQRPHRLVRAGLPDADRGARGVRRGRASRRRRKQLYGLDDKTTEIVRQAVPAGPAAGGARRPLRAGLSHGHGEAVELPAVGPARRPQDANCRTTAPRPTARSPAC